MRKTKIIQCIMNGNNFQKRGTQYRMLHLEEKNRKIFIFAKWQTTWEENAGIPHNVSWYNLRCSQKVWDQLWVIVPHRYGLLRSFKLVKERSGGKNDGKTKGSERWMERETEEIWLSHLSTLSSITFKHLGFNFPNY